MLLRAEAPAKINRELRVGGRRADGYHEIRSRMVSIDLADRLEVETAEELTFSCAGAAVPADDSNLVVRAAQALARYLRIVPLARIRLEKRVPVGAGLGGGSADAAVTLRLLAQLWGSELTKDEVSPIASGLGSDVPFFLVGGEADVAGRGERVSAREDASPVELLLLVPPFSVSTRDVYARFDRSAGPKDILLERLEIETSPRFFGPNDLAPAVLEAHPVMADYLRSAQQAAAEYGITGSGSTIVLCGVTPGGEGWLTKRHPEATVQRTRTLSREEYRGRTGSSGGSAWKSLR